MGSINTFTASGQGSLVIDGGTGHYITELVAKIVTPADFAVLTGVSPIRRVHKQCWFGLGFLAGGGPLAGDVIVNFGKYLERELEDIIMSIVSEPFADTIYWDVHDGGVMYFEADW